MSRLLTLAESDLSGNITNEYVFFAGRRIARISSGTVNYFYSDALGTIHTITDGTGHPCYDASFTPYGQEVLNPNISQTCSSNYKFTGDEYDSESGLYYALARYYSPRLDRFMSPDLLAGSIVSAQSLNRYAYVANNPLNAVDTIGLVPGGCMAAQERGVSRSAGEDACGDGPTSADCIIDGGMGLCSPGSGDGISASTGGGFSDSTVQCPNNVCNGVDVNGQYMEFTCGAEACSYLSLQTISQGLYEWNGQLLTAEQWNQLTQAYRDYMKALIAATLSAILGKDIEPSDLGDLGLRGGNANFSLDPSLLQAVVSSDLSCESGWLGTRCGDFNLHFGTTNGVSWVHMDSADPYTGFWGGFTHVLLDGLGGNTIWQAGVPH